MDVRSSPAAAGPRAGGSTVLGQVAVAVLLVQLGAGDRAPTRIVQAPAGVCVDQLAIRADQPLLVRRRLVVGAGAGRQLDLRTVQQAQAGYVQALAVDPKGSVHGENPFLRGTSVTAIDLDLGAVGGTAGGVIHALAGHAGLDRAGRQRPGLVGRAVAGIDLELGAGRGAGAGVIQAPSGRPGGQPPGAAQGPPLGAPPR